MPLTVLARYTSPWEAHVIRALLESEGVSVHLFDEHMVGCNWMQSDLFGNVKLIVHDHQYAMAAEIFEQYKAGVFLQALSDEHNLAQRHCPSCNARDFHLYPTVANRALQVLYMILFGFFHPLLWGRFKCASCHHCFEANDF
jgi:Putative prokaryotic signal transducing protein